MGPHLALELVVVEEREDVDDVLEAYWVEHGLELFQRLLPLHPVARRHVLERLRVERARDQRRRGEVEAARLPRILRELAAEDAELLAELDVRVQEGVAPPVGEVRRREELRRGGGVVRQHHDAARRRR